MTIDRSVIGQQQAPFEATVERGRLQLFAEVIGQKDRLFWDVEVARAAGHPDIPAPPTFLFGLDAERPNAYDWMADLGIDLRTVLHGEQGFRYFNLAYAGDRLKYSPQITDAYEKKGGALKFYAREVRIERESEPIANLSQIIVVRQLSVAL